MGLGKKGENTHIRPIRVDWQGCDEVSLMRVGHATLPTNIVTQDSQYTTQVNQMHPPLHPGAGTEKNCHCLVRFEI